MKPTEKPCKGSGKALNFGCGNETLYRRYGLCPKCYPDFILNSEAGKVLMQKAMLKGRKEAEKKAVIETKQKKEEFTNWRSKLQDEIQKISRLIDIGLPCLAKGYHAGQIHGGHVFAKGGNSSMALNLHNIHRQSAQSNKWGNDDGLLREGLKKEYGEKYLDFVSELRSTPQLHFTNIEFKALYRKACEISRRMIREGKTFDLAGRIEARNEINIELGIYDKEYCIYNL